MPKKSTDIFFEQTLRVNRRQINYAIRLFKKHKKNAWPRNSTRRDKHRTYWVSCHERYLPGLRLTPNPFYGLEFQLNDKRLMRGIQLCFKDGKYPSTIVFLSDTPNNIERNRRARVIAEHMDTIIQYACFGKVIFGT